MPSKRSFRIGQKQWGHGEKARLNFSVDGGLHPLQKEVVTVIGQRPIDSTEAPQVYVAFDRPFVYTTGDGTGELEIISAVVSPSFLEEVANE